MTKQIMTTDKPEALAESDIDAPRLVRFVYPGHRYHGLVGEIIEGDIECCILRFHEIGRDFGPCFQDQQGKLELIRSTD